MLAPIVGRASCVLTCQKRAAAPMKPGELSISPAMRLCDDFALAGMIRRYYGVWGMVAC
jgi:hypothetical protein